MQSGPGVFKGDLHFYMIDGDIRGKIDEIDGKAANLYLLTGEYDYSCTTEGTLDIARRTGAPGHHHGRPRPFPHERGPGAVPHLSAAGAGEDSRSTTSNSVNAPEQSPRFDTGC